MISSPARAAEVMPSVRETASTAVRIKNSPFGPRNARHGPSGSRSHNAMNRQLIPGATRGLKSSQSPRSVHHRMAHGFRREGEPRRLADGIAGEPALDEFVT